MIDHAERQRHAIIKENLQFVAEGVSQEAWVTGVRARRFPPGSRYFWALMEVWGPSRPAEERQAAE